MASKPPLGALNQLLIAIRGAKQTGKSSLQRRMCGKPFVETYTATSITQARTMRWVPRTKAGMVVTITLLDVVSMNPRVTATSQGMPHGVIVIYNPAEKDSIDYALKMIRETARNIPIALLTNFQDVVTTDLHPKFRSLTKRCFPIGTSMKTNLGLAELAKWLELPFALNIYNTYHNLYTMATKEVKRLNSMFDPENPKVRVGVVQDMDDEDGFWSDDDTNLASQIKRTRRQQGKTSAKRKELPDLENIQMYAPKQELAMESQKTQIGVKDDDDLMQAIIQTAASSKRVIGLDEIDFDKEHERRPQIVPPTAPSQVKVPTVTNVVRKERKHVHKHKHRSKQKRRNDSFLPGAAPIRPQGAVFRPASQMRQDIPLASHIPQNTPMENTVTQPQPPARFQHSDYNML